MTSTGLLPGLPPQSPRLWTLQGVRTYRPRFASGEHTDVRAVVTYYAQRGRTELRSVQHSIEVVRTLERRDGLLGTGFGKERLVGGPRKGRHDPPRPRRQRYGVPRRCHQRHP